MGESKGMTTVGDLGKSPPFIIPAVGFPAPAFQTMSSEHTPFLFFSSALCAVSDQRGKPVFDIRFPDRGVPSRSEWWGIMSRCIFGLEISTRSNTCCIHLKTQERGK